MPIMLKMLLLLIVCTTYFCESYIPIVLWHGVADTCCNEERTMGIIAKAIKETLPEIYILSIQIGKDSLADYFNSITMHPDKQIEIVCQMIKDDPLLANGYNALGFSQGSQFLRGLVQRCPGPKMKNLITLSGQHQGIYGIPMCEPVSRPNCDSLRKMVNYLVYSGVIQDVIVPASYWHNPLDRAAYLKGNTFLADINNERYINETYIKKLQSLENFVMVKYENDTVVIPKESAWFGFYKEGQDREIEHLHDSQVYISNQLGLKEMDQDGKLHFISNNWEHTDFDKEWFKENIIDRFIR